MKTLRTICYVCAGYYFMQALGFWFANFVVQRFFAFIPAAQRDGNPVFDMQEQLIAQLQRFSPFILIGAVACLLMAVYTKRLWHFIPFLAVLLFGAGLFLSFSIDTSDMGRAFVMEGDGAPAEVEKILAWVAVFYKWCAAAPLLFPGILILVFWFIARKREQKSQSSELITAAS